jgi:thiol:disulfide interchange protein DsbD
MPPYKRVSFSIAILLIAISGIAQDSLPITFSFSQKRVNDSTVVASLKAKIKPGIKLYPLQKKGYTIFSGIHFDSACTNKLEGTISEIATIQSEKDSIIDAEVHFITGSVEWQQKIKLSTADSIVLKGSVDVSYKKNDEYLSGSQPFKIFVQPSISRSQDAIENKSLWWIFLAAFAGGLLALLTPCVYSMIPVTVSFFTKRSKTKAEGKRNAVYYALSIVSIFTLLGFLVTLIFGPAALNSMATNWIANLLFFVLFLVFGISFLGAFDISLPSSWSTKADTKAGTGNFWGIFFMALTLVLVSFSCTGPIIGNLLVLAAKGSYLGPLTGMFGFSLALSLPFALFAFFPGKLNVLGKAGGWLNAIKVTLGFLELALALKFLSNADLSKGWRLLDREIFISLWVVIFVLLGGYLLGKLKFHHDDELPKNDFGIPYISIPRLLFAIAAFSFAVYMMPGLWGAPLKGISAFIPPMGTQDFNASAGNNTPASFINEDGKLPQPVKYAAQMKMYEPDVVTKFGMVTYFDYSEALAVAKKLHKPLMLDFTGINCVNCRKMEGQVWSDPSVMKRLKENFVIVSLYVDVKNIDLRQGEIYFSKALGKNVETLGDWNADLQVTKFSANSQPYYFFLDGNENKLVQEGYGYNPDIQKFIHHLDMVKEAYNRLNR